ncbi:hypothetical protein [Lichenicoccus sp.]|uniref:hypothetical protein n=1 Tax=Lichenicoccus sp. TaxID=2781899 RepID=UPI003D09C30D
MNQDAGEDVHKTRALELSNIGICSGADGKHEIARDAWQEALAYAQQHLPGNTMIPWIQASLGNALFECADYPGALEIAGAALTYCASVRAPLAALTMAKSYLRLDDVQRAREYAGQAYRLRGPAVLNAFSTADREELGPFALSQDPAPDEREFDDKLSLIDRIRL